KQRPDWVTGAKSRVVLQGTGDWLMSLLPDDPENTILKRLKKNKPEDDQADSGEPPPPGSDGYSKPARDSLEKLIEKPAVRRRSGQKRGAMDETKTPEHHAQLKLNLGLPEAAPRDLDFDPDLDLDLDGDTLREECGVFGIFGHSEAAAITAL